MRGRFTVFRGRRGFTLIEVLVSLAILAAIGVAFLNGLFTTSKAIMVSQESTAAESLARSQMEYIKTQEYILVAEYNPSDPAYSYYLIDVRANLAGAGYSVEIDAPVVIISKAEVEFELQGITVVVKRGGEKVFTLSAYRVEGY